MRKPPHAHPAQHSSDKGQSCKNLRWFGTHKKLFWLWNASPKSQNVQTLHQKLVSSKPHKVQTLHQKPVPNETWSPDPKSRLTKESIDRLHSQVAQKVQDCWMASHWGRDSRVGSANCCAHTETFSCISQARFRVFFSLTAFACRPPSFKTSVF